VLAVTAFWLVRWRTGLHVGVPIERKQGGKQMSGAIDPGQTITVQNGTSLTATGHIYANDTIMLGTFPAGGGQGATLDLQGHATVGTVQTQFFTTDTIDVSGHAHIGNLTEGAQTSLLTVDLEAGSSLNATINAGGYTDELVVNGAVHSHLVNDSDSVVNVASIGADVIGHGSWSFLAHPPGGGFLEFGGAVSHGQTVDLGFNSTLHIDDPNAFKGIVNAGSVWSDSYGNILLGGVQADSWSYRNDMLTLYDNGKAVDRLRIEEASGAAPFSVGQGGGGIVISGQLGQIGTTLLPEVNHGHVMVGGNIS
jgi:hypothetical protein